MIYPLLPDVLKVIVLKSNLFCVAVMRTWGPETHFEDDNSYEVFEHMKESLHVRILEIIKLSH